MPVGGCEGVCNVVVVVFCVVFGGVFFLFLCYIFKPLNICAKYNMLLCDK